jgi:hypothetical protein
MLWTPPNALSTVKWISIRTNEQTIEQMGGNYCGIVNMAAA